MPSRPGPQHVVALPLSTIYGREPSEWEEWGLVDPTEDDPAIVECANEDIAQYVARLWNEDHQRGDDDAEFRVRKNAPDTSKAIVDKIRSSSLQAVMLRAFQMPTRADGTGWTDDELEVYFQRTHQSVSATRNTLMRKGYVEPTEARRKTRSGNPAIVYAWTGKEAR